MDLHIYVHFDGLAPLVEAIQQGVSTLNHTITQQGSHMSEALDALTVEVQNTTGVMQSAMILIQGLAQRLADAGTDPVQLEALRHDLEENETALAAAVAANQPPSPSIP